MHEKPSEIAGVRKEDRKIDPSWTDLDLERLLSLDLKINIVDRVMKYYYSSKEISGGASSSEEVSAEWKVGQSNREGCSGRMGAQGYRAVYLLELYSN